MISHLIASLHKKYSQTGTKYQEKILLNPWNRLEVVSFHLMSIMSLFACNKIYDSLKYSHYVLTFKRSTGFVNVIVT